MDALFDVALLSRIQFAVTVAYHFIFVPLSIGLGLITAIFATKYYRSRDEKDGAAMHFWVRIFTATFAIGVATGITMEFSFGTNWADYSRFVGDIFGAPLAAEALLPSSWNRFSLVFFSLAKRRCRLSSTWCRHGLCGQVRA